jgi:hypothetical protein
MGSGKANTAALLMCSWPNVPQEEKKGMAEMQMQINKKREMYFFMLIKNRSLKLKKNKQVGVILILND